MSTLLAEAAQPRGASTGSQPAASAPGPTVRSVLTGYAWTLLVPLLGLAPLLAGWAFTAASGWPAAVAAAGAWAAGSGAWLHRRAWSPVLVHLVVWIAPMSVLAPLAGVGWLTSDGLVLWAPLTTLLAVGLALAHEPLPVTASRG